MLDLNIYSASSTIRGSAKIGRRKHIKLMMRMSAVEQLQPIGDSAGRAILKGTANGRSILHWSIMAETTSDSFCRSSRQSWPFPKYCLDLFGAYRYYLIIAGLR